MKFLKVLFEFSYLAVLVVCDTHDVYVPEASNHDTYRMNPSMSFLRPNYGSSKYLSPTIFRIPDKVKRKAPEFFTQFFPDPLSLPQHSVMKDYAGSETYSPSFNLDNVRRENRLNHQSRHIFKRGTNTFEDTEKHIGTVDANIDVGQDILLGEPNDNKIETDEHNDDSMKTRNKRTLEDEENAVNEALKLVINEIQKGYGKSNQSQVAPEETRRLIMGQDGSVESYPFVVSIQKDGEHWCAGALLNPKIVMTTANCVWKSTYKSFMRVRACTTKAHQGGQGARILEVMKHPQWDITSGPDNDIAMLLLDRNIKFSFRCHGVDIPNRNMMPSFGEVFVVGWGAERRDGVFVRQMRTLQTYQAKVMEIAKCRNITMRFGVNVTDNFFCVSQLNHRAPCTRDTGAPAVGEGVLWGLASWGLRRQCGTERYPAMFTNLAAPPIQDFIIEATKRLMKDNREPPFLDSGLKPKNVPASLTEAKGEQVPTW